MPTVWWLRPVRSAARVGAQRAVVWTRLSLSPVAARRSAVGVLTGPPNALDAANPTSSSKTIRTFGAPGGGRRDSIGAKLASRASKGTSPSNGVSGIGRTSRPGASSVIVRSPCLSGAARSRADLGEVVWARVPGRPVHLARGPGHLAGIDHTRPGDQVDHDPEQRQDDDQHDPPGLAATREVLAAAAVREDHAEHPHRQQPREK